MAKRRESNVIPQELIENKIYLIRGEKVMLDRDLASLYGVPTKILNKAVKRNLPRFPTDFMFRLTASESQDILRFQNGTSKRGGRRYAPYAFTENGVAMLSGVLNSPRAIAVNIQIIRTFIKIRKFLATHQDILNRLELLEINNSEQDGKIAKIFEVINHILNLPIIVKRKSKPIGFLPPARAPKT